MAAKDSVDAIRTMRWLDPAKSQSRDGTRGAYLWTMPKWHFVMCDEIIVCRDALKEEARGHKRVCPSQISFNEWPLIAYVNQNATLYFINMYSYKVVHIF